MRLIADVAVIGFPNAGKSSLVGALSAAHPKVADYAFTTIEPSLGVVEWDDERFTICDIPGLVEGASSGKGLGIKFLRHAQRSPILCHLIDLASDRDHFADYMAIKTELAAFQPDLGARPEVIGLNKIDAAGPVEARQVKDLFNSKGLEAYEISVTEKLGLDELTIALCDRVVKARKERQPSGFELFRTPADKVTVTRETKAWRVDGAAIRRWVAMTDMANPEAVDFLQGRLERAGVEKALGEAGAKHGDEVRIGAAAFEWWPAGTHPTDKSVRVRGRGR